MAACLTENTLAGFLEGRLPSEDATRLQEHVAQCSDCRGLLVALASAVSLPSAGLASEASASAAALARLGLDASSGEETAVVPPPSQLEEYCILGFLGQGSMGRVYLGRDTRLDRLVAIKFLRPFAQAGAERGRLLREARAAARIQHPNVVSIYRVGEHQGQLYLVSEFVRGQSLDRLAKPLPWPKVLTIGIALSRGLAAAHQQGVLHRDIKPANVILTVDGEVKLLDFGLAKLSAAPAVEVAPATQTEHPDESLLGRDSEGPQATLSRSGMLIGTPRYMAPELWRGEAASPRSDLYSLGALLYELGTGRVPHHGVTQLAELRERVQRDELPALHVIAAALQLPPLPAPLSDAVMRCLDPNPEQRIGHASELLTLLLAVSPTSGPRPLRTVAGLVLGLGLLAAGALLWFGKPWRNGKVEPGWQALPAMAVARGYTCAAYVPHEVYVFGGVSEPAADLISTLPTGVVEKFDFTQQRWSAAAAMPIPTFASRCVALEGKIYVLGGRVATAAHKSENSDRVQVFDPVTKRWSSAARMPRQRAWFGAAVLNRKIYVIGGAGQRGPAAKNGYLSSTDVYDPERDSWTPFAGQLALGRYMLGATAQAGSIFVVGGSSFPAPDEHPDAQASTRYTLIEELAERGGGTARILARLPGPLGEVEIFSLQAESLLLSDTRFLYRLQPYEGRLTELLPLRPGIISHDTAMVLTPHGLLAVGGGGSGQHSAAAHLYRLPL